MRPATTSTQRCDEFHTRIEPEARVSRHLDYFGTEVLEFGIPTSHDHLTIDVRARVVTSAPPEPPEGSWDSLGSPAYVDAAGEFALPVAGPARDRGHRRPRTREMDCRQPAADARSVLCELIPDRFEYRPGATYVGSTVSDLLESRRRASARTSSTSRWSCCAAAGSRPATSRATCGRRPRTTARTRVEVDTHAWLEALLPGTDGRGEPVWVSADPTNRRLAGETHVKIGHGRFYADVPPVKGLYMGGATSELHAAVTMSRLDPQASARA